MPNTPSAKKRLRQSLAHRQSNRAVRSELRTRMRQILSMDSASDAEAALPRLYSALDRAARKGIVPPKAAARQKARVARHVRKLAGS